MKPTKISREQLIAALDDIRARIEADDSMEGNLAYAWGDEHGNYDVQAVWRVGNSMGQGGMRTIGDMTSEPQKIPSQSEWAGLLSTERARQIDRGYTDEHDDESGASHLVWQAIDYARQGRNVESATIVYALGNLLARLGVVEDGTPAPWGVQSS